VLAICADTCSSVGCMLYSAVISLRRDAGRWYSIPALVFVCWQADLTRNIFPSDSMAASSRMELM